ncbi:hypothetical protein D3C81_1058770 [compost metagenome]
MNTDYSVPLNAYEDSDGAFSPWIHAELQFSSVVRRRTPMGRKWCTRDNVVVENRRAQRRIPNFTFIALNSQYPKNKRFGSQQIVRVFVR